MAAETLHITQNSSLPPAQPAYVLRGHSAQIHSVLFFRQNLRLLSGDADGWVVLWNLPVKRPVAVWRAHKSSILGLSNWGEDRIITHGRDNKLIVWRLCEGDESRFSTVLPIEDAVTERAKPVLLHSLPVNALNFCSFTKCDHLRITNPAAARNGAAQPDGILTAVPGLQDGHVNVTALPSEERIATIVSPMDINTGMVMALGLHYVGNDLLVLVGYENGYACIWKQSHTAKQWQTSYSNKAHSQPILSLDVAPGLGYFYTSSADAVIARHPLVEGSADTRLVQTKHAGQQSLTVRSDEKIFATAGWDGRARVYSAKTMKELAVLKWHKEGCYALAFANVDPIDVEDGATDGNGVVVKRDLTVSEQRTAKARSTHWLAAGSKDGKISLWDIY
ncbi:hypothetical protein LTR36_004269 [Oleoguttula mirabilis]|uniref:ASTRA-associated protein 1 n=1 Tax=Oleoguttula mirabilis TaxID=1507867 RepID=A0AAV9JHD9_9PEZI|nr:hypothetical protein LTR36_004269 [Oleoguttula mirabilis]